MLVCAVDYDAPVADVKPEPFSELYFYDITDLVYLCFETHESKHRHFVWFAWSPGLCAC